MRIQRKQTGTVEGQLSFIGERKGSLQLELADELTDHRIKCRIDEADLFRAMASFRRRVMVHGEVHYRKDGSPSSVRVQRIIPVPSGDELPGIDEVRGILS